MLRHKGLECDFSASGIVPRERIEVVWEQSSAPVDTSCGVDLDRFALLLSGTEPTQVLPSCEEILEPPVIAHDAVDDPSARAHDLRGQQNDCV